MARYNILTIMFAVLALLPAFAHADPLFENPLNLTVNGAQVETIPQLLLALIDVGLMLAYPLAAGIIIYAGFKMATAQGDAKKAGEARKMVEAAAIGFAIIIASKGLQLVIQSTLESLK